MYTYVYTRRDVYLHIYTCMYVYMYIHIYVHIYVYMVLKLIAVDFFMFLSFTGGSSSNKQQNFKEKVSHFTKFYFKAMHKASHDFYAAT